MEKWKKFRRRFLAVVFTSSNIWGLVVVLWLLGIVLALFTPAAWYGLGEARIAAWFLSPILVPGGAGLILWLIRQLFMTWGSRKELVFRSDGSGRLLDWGRVVWGRGFGFYRCGVPYQPYCGLLFLELRLGQWSVLVKPFFRSSFETPEIAGWLWEKVYHKGYPSVAKWFEAAVRGVVAGPLSELAQDKNGRETATERADLVHQILSGDTAFWKTVLPENLTRIEIAVQDAAVKRVARR